MREKENPRDAWWKRAVAEAVCAPVRFPITTLALVLICIGLSIWGVRSTHFTGSLENMMAKDDPSSGAMVKVLNHFSAVEEMLLLVDVPGESSENAGADAAKLLAFAERLKESIESSPAASAMIADVMYRADPQSIEFFKSVVVPAGAYYLDDATFAAVRERLTDQGIRRQIQRDEAILSAPGPAGTALSKIILQDPLRLHEFILKRMGEQKPFETFEGSDAFLTPDGKSLLIRISGTRPPSDLEFAQKLTRVVGNLAHAANIDGLNVQLTGSYAIAAESELSIKHDMIISVISSIVLMQLLFLVMYRNPSSFIICIAPVAAGILIGLGAHALFSTMLTPITAVIGALLAGMGIDYTIEYLSQYEQSRGEGLSSLAAGERTSLFTSPAILAACATSIIGFLAIYGSSIQALRDFALVGSLGLAGSFLAAVVLLPAVLRLFDRNDIAGKSQRNRLRFGMNGFVELAARHPWPFIGFVGVLFIVGAAITLDAGRHVLDMSADLTVLHPQPNRAIDAQLEIGRRFANPTPLIVLLEADSQSDLVRKAYEVRRRLSNAVMRDVGIGRTAGLAMLLPDPDTIPRRTKELADIDVNQVLASLRAALADSVFDPDQYVPAESSSSHPTSSPALSSSPPHGAYAAFLRRLLAPATIPDVQTLLDYPKLAELFVPREAIAREGSTPAMAITLVFTDRPLTERAARDALLARVRNALNGLNGVTLTGMGVISHDGELLVRRDLPRLLFIALALVIVYLLIHFRNAKDAMLALLPAGFAMLWVLTIMHVSGMGLNLVNLIAAPLLIGMCVDYPIFMISLARQTLPRKGNRATATQRRELITRLGGSAHAVLICAATCIIGYGSLAWTSVPAIRSFGILVATGIAAALVATFFLIVPILVGKVGNDSSSPDN